MGVALESHEPASEARRLKHGALLYGEPTVYAERVVPFLQEGLDDGESVLAVAPRDRLATLRDGLGSDAERVTFIDSNSFYTRPVRVLSAYTQTVRREIRSTRRVRAIAEIPFGPTSLEWDEWTSYEAIINRALAPLPLWVVCAYNEGEMPQQLIDAMWRTHPEVGTDDWAVSPHFEAPEDVVRANAVEPRPLPELRSSSPGADPASFRERLAEELAAQDVPPLRAIDMILAANEVAENAWVHGGGPEELRVGRVDGRFVCEIVDRGEGFDDPFAGFIPPDLEGKPAGLYVARQLTWKLEHFDSDRGHTVRLWL
jgi:anti-sigma regulatory factor (Ser/Thr protein kinase)